MLAYCVNHLSLLKAHFISEHLAGIRAKSKRGHITELQLPTCIKTLLQNIFIMKDECRLLTKVCLKRLKFNATWAFGLSYSIVIVGLSVS